jgi:putative spermidine/putrescine transport system permease protein
MRRRSGTFYLQLSFTLLVCLFLIVPVVLSVLAGITVNFFHGLKSGITLQWVMEVWRLYSDTIFLSLLISLACLATTIVVGVPAAYVLAKRGGAVARMIEEMLTLPLAIPGLAIALALLITYGGVREFRASWLFILVGHVLYTLPFMIRAVMAVLSSTNFRTLEEGAASLGATFWQRFFGIVVPNCRSGILAGSLMVVTLSIGEFNITWMLHTPLTKTLPVGLADSYASMRLEIGSAYTLIFLVMILPLLVAMQLWAQPRKRRSILTELEASAADLDGLKRLVIREPVRP